MNPFDLSIIRFFNGFAHQSLTFDNTVALIASRDLPKMWLIIPLLWWFWFQRQDKRETNRDRVLATIAACFMSLLLARSLAAILPFRIRPLQNSALQFRLPYGVSNLTLIGWSSFPSDHAAMVASLATGIFLISRAPGLLSAVYALAVVLLPRLYLGIHYPTDLIVGTLIGICTSCLAHTEQIRARIADPFRKWLDRHPQSFYAFAFLLTWQMANQFDDLRTLGSFFRDLAMAKIRFYFH